MTSDDLLSTGRLGAKQRASARQQESEAQFEMFDNTMDQPRQDTLKVILDTNHSIAEMSQILPEDSVQFIDD